MIELKPYNYENRLGRCTSRDEYGNADVKGVDMSFMLGLPYEEMAILAQALNRLADFEDAEIAEDKKLREKSNKKMNDDLISRQAAIEILRNRWLKTRNYDGIGEDIAEECEIYLKTLPSAQPEKVCIANITLSEEQIREAVEKALESNRENVRATLRDDHGSYRCTNCNALISDEIDYVLEDYKPIQFCPNCGAYMRGDSDE